jgi:membrane protease YdiL (CAAX protease family)
MTKTTFSDLFIRDRRLRSGWRVGLYLACYLIGLFAVQTPVVILYVGYLMLQEGASTSRLWAAVQMDRWPIWLFLALKVAELAMLLPLTYLFARFLDRRDWTSLGFRRDRGWMLDLLLGLAIGGVQMLTILGIEWAGGWLTVGWPGNAAFIQGMIEATIAAGLFVLVAVGEELVFRGYLQVNLREGIGLLPALALTALLFGVFHAINPNFSWMALFNIVLAGISMSYGKVVTGNLWLPIAYHLSWNFFQGPILALPVSGMRFGGLLAVVDSGAAPFFTGAAFGPEGGLIGTLVLLASFPLFWLWGHWRRPRIEIPG